MFTAIADMEPLVSTEAELVRNLENYIQAEEQRLQLIKTFVWMFLLSVNFSSLFCFRLKEEYEKMYEEASADVSKYLSNPINAYLLVKRLTSDWKQIEGIMTQNTGPGMAVVHYEKIKITYVYLLIAFIQNITQYRSILRFPTDEDLNGAAVALMRLQDTYLLDTHAIAQGQLQGKKYSRKLTGNTERDALYFKSYLTILPL